MSRVQGSRSGGWDIAYGALTPRSEAMQNRHPSSAVPRHTAPHCTVQRSCLPEVTFPRGAPLGPAAARQQPRISPKRSRNTRRTTPQRHLRDRFVACHAIRVQACMRACTRPAACADEPRTPERPGTWSRGVGVCSGIGSLSGLPAAYDWRCEASAAARRSERVSKMECCTKRLRPSVLL